MQQIYDNPGHGACGDYSFGTGILMLIAQGKLPALDSAKQEVMMNVIATLPKTSNLDWKDKVKTWDDVVKHFADYKACFQRGANHGNLRDAQRQIYPFIRALLVQLVREQKTDFIKNHFTGTATKQEFLQYAGAYLQNKLKGNTNQLDVRYSKLKELNKNLDSIAEQFKDLEPNHPAVQQFFREGFLEDYSDKHVAKYDNPLVDEEDDDVTPQEIASIKQNVLDLVPHLPGIIADYLKTKNNGWDAYLQNPDILMLADWFEVNVGLLKESRHGLNPSEQVFKLPQLPAVISKLNPKIKTAMEDAALINMTKNSFAHGSESDNYYAVQGLYQLRNELFPLEIPLSTFVHAFFAAQNLSRPHPDFMLIHRGDPNGGHWVMQEPAPSKTMTPPHLLAMLPPPMNINDSVIAKLPNLPAGLEKALKKCRANYYNADDSFTDEVGEGDNLQRKTVKLKVRELFPPEEEDQQPIIPIDEAKQIQLALDSLFIIMMRYPNKCFDQEIFDYLLTQNPNYAYYEAWRFDHVHYTYQHCQLSKGDFETVKNILKNNQIDSESFYKFYIDYSVKPSKDRKKHYSSLALIAQNSSIDRENFHQLQMQMLNSQHEISALLRTPCENGADIVSFVLDNGNTAQALYWLENNLHNQPLPKSTDGSTAYDKICQMMFQTNSPLHYFKNRKELNGKYLQFFETLENELRAIAKAVDDEELADDNVEKTYVTQNFVFLYHELYELKEAYKDCRKKDDQLPLLKEQLPKFLSKCKQKADETKTEINNHDWLYKLFRNLFMSIVNRGLELYHYSYKKLTASNYEVTLFPVNCVSSSIEHMGRTIAQTVEMIKA